jgi:hypothetical protein
VGNPTKRIGAYSRPTFLKTASQCMHAWDINENCSCDTYGFVIRTESPSRTLIILRPDYIPLQLLQHTTCHATVPYLGGIYADLRLFGTVYLYFGNQPQLMSIVKASMTYSYCHASQYEARTAMKGSLCRAQIK